MSEFRLVALAILALALAFLAGGWAMPLGTITAPGAGLAPMLLAGGTALAAAATMLLPQPAPSEDAAPLSPKALAIVAVLGLVILAFETAGFVVSVFVGAFVLTKIIERQSLLTSLAISAVLSGGCYFLFDRVLRVVLP